MWWVNRILSVPGVLKNNMKFLSEFSSFTRNVDFAGRIIRNDKGEEVFNFGKYKDMPLIEVFERDPGYYSWILQGDFPLNTKQVLTRIKLQSR
jgi:DNA polymerase-3 subunit epsilon